VIERSRWPLWAVDDGLLGASLRRRFRSRGCCAASDDAGFVEQVHGSLTILHRAALVRDDNMDDLPVALIVDGDAVAVTCGRKHGLRPAKDVAGGLMAGPGDRPSAVETRSCCQLWP